MTMELIESFCDEVYEEDDEKCGPDKDIIVVHGLSRGGDKPWIATESRPAWLRRNLFSNSNARVLGFNYDDVFGGDKPVYNRAGLDIMAQQLLDDTMAWRESENRPLMILSHDIGGILVKMALVIASGDPDRYGQLLSSTYALVFAGCPHRASGVEKLTNDFATLIYNARIVPEIGLLDAAKLCATTAMEVNCLFLDSNIPFRVQILSIFSEVLDPISRVLNEFTATLDLSCETRMGLSSPHDTLLGHESDEKADQLLKKTLEFSPEGTGSLRCQSLQYLLSTVSPPPAFQIEPNYNALDTWQLEEDLRNCIENHASLYTRFILVSEQSSSRTIGNFVRLVSKTRSTVRPETRTFVFQLRKLKLHPEIETGILLSSIRQVLESFVAQALAYLAPRMQPDEWPDKLVSAFGVVSSSAKPLGEHFLKILFVALNGCLWRMGTRAIWSIWNLEHCSSETELARLVETVTGLFQFTTFKPAIFFSASGHSTFNLTRIMQEADIRCFHLKPREELSQDMKLQFSTDLLRPEGPGQALREVPKLIDAILRESKDDRLCETFMQWVIMTARISATKSQWLQKAHEAVGDNGQLEPQRLRIAIWSSLTREDNRLANSVLQWVRHCCRPLSPTELITGLSLEGVTARSEESSLSEHQTRSESYTTFRSIQNRLSGIIEVTDNEVRPTFDEVDETNSADSWRSVSAESNFLITRCLLRHLSLEAERIDLGVSQSGPIPPSVFHHNFTAYAANFWPHHYRLARCHSSTKSRVESFVATFLKDEQAAVLLMLRYMRSTVAEVPRNENLGDTPVATIGLLTCYGFDDIEEIGILSSCPGWERLTETAFSALLEAVRGSHTKLLDKLSVSMLEDLEDESMREILSSNQTGQLSGDLVYNLFRQVQSRDTFQLPVNFVLCAAFAGIEEIAKELKNCAMDSSEWTTCLLRAISIPKLETAEMMAPLAEPHLSDEQKKEILSVAFLIWKPSRIASLMGWLKMDVLFQHLPAAVNSGNHVAVEELLASLFQNVTHSDYISNEYVEESLYAAVRYSSVEIVRAILKHADVVRDNTGLAGALFHAVQNSASREICLLLLETGMDLDNDLPDPYLSQAVRDNNMELAQIFVEYGVSIDARDSFGVPPLYRAANNGLLPMVKFLIDKGADVNVKTDQGLTPLYGASLDSKPDVVEYLLSKGADVSIASDERNWSPLECAYDYPDVLTHLVTKASPPPDYHRETDFGDSKVTALFLAARHNHLESVRLLLKHGGPNIDIEFAPSSDIGTDDPTTGFTPLATACLYSHTSVARLLLEHGANVKHRIPNRDQTALHFVTSEDTLAVLLEYGADIEAKELYGYTPLNLHADQSDLSLIRRLVNAGANLETPDRWGDTPLMNCVLNNRQETFRYLVSKGALVNCRGAYFGSPLHKCCRFGKLEMFKLALELDADANLWHPCQGTPLEAACYDFDQDNLTIVRYLIEEKSIDINAPPSYIRSVMGQAFWTGGEALITYLLNNGGSINATDGTGLPSFFNICFRQNDALEVFNRLLDTYGADALLQKQDKMCRTILHCAAFAGNLPLVERILELEPKLVEGQDIDGWSALHWSARPPALLDSRKEKAQQNNEARAAVIKFLARKGCPGLTEYVTGDGSMWNVLEIAEYHGASDVIVDAVREMMDDEQPQGESTKSSPTYRDDWSCDACNAFIWGKLFKCTADGCCDFIGLCFKCQPHKDLVHDPEHVFVEEALS